MKRFSLMQFLDILGMSAIADKIFEKNKNPGRC